MSLTLFIFLYTEVFCTVRVVLSFLMKTALNNKAEILQAVSYWY